MNTLVVILLATLAALCFGRALWLHVQPPERDGCWRKPVGFHRQRRKRK